MWIESLEKHLVLFNDKVRFGEYEYPIKEFAQSKILGVIVDSLSSKEARMILEGVFKKYQPLAKSNAHIKHKGINKRTTKTRDNKLEQNYGTYKSIIIQVKNLHEERIFKLKLSGQYEDYKLLPYPDTKESEEVENSI